MKRIAFLITIAVVGFAFFLSKNKQPSTNAPVETQTNVTWETTNIATVHVKHPKSWIVQNWENQEQRLENFKLLFILSKPNLSNDTSALDEPTKNAAMIDVGFLYTEVSLEELVTNFEETAGFRFNSIEYVTKNGVFANFPAIYVHEYIGPEGVTSAYPTHILAKTGNDKVLVISADFFDSSVDQNYSQTTIKEINEIISSIDLN